MTKAIVFLAEGFEEMEALGTVDILRRGGVGVITVSITDNQIVKGSHGIPVTADATIDKVDLDSADALILPGGMPGSTNLDASSVVKDALMRQFKAGHIVAAICAAPMVLGGLGILEGRNATCYPGFEEKMRGAHATGGDVEVAGNVITGRGPGLVMKFALTLVAALKGEAAAKEVAAGMLLC